MNRTLRSSIVATNKKVLFHYELVHKYEAGIVLKGSEVKSIRLGKAHLKGSFISFKSDEAYINNMNISTNEKIHNNKTNSRKLLLHKSELKKLRKGIDNNGMTIVPTALKISSKGLIKIDISLARGRTNIDKRELIKKRDTDRKIRKYI